MASKKPSPVKSFKKLTVLKKNSLKPHLKATSVVLIKNNFDNNGVTYKNEMPSEIENETIKNYSESKSEFSYVANTEINNEHDIITSQNTYKVSDVSIDKFLKNNTLDNSKDDALTNNYENESDDKIESKNENFLKSKNQIENNTDNHISDIKIEMYNLRNKNIKTNLLQNSENPLNVIDSYVNTKLSDSFNGINSHITNGSSSGSENFLSMSSVKVYNSSIKISENPFDFLEDKAISIIETPKTQETLKKPTLADDRMLSVIRKSKKREIEIKKGPRIGVFDKIEILSKKEITLPVKKYYKFPFELSLINDESYLSMKLVNTFASAFNCAYSNYRRFGESFIVVLFNDIFVFSKQLKCTLGTLRLLKSNEIKFTVHDDCIIIDDNDRALVSDIIMNAEIPKGKPLPFILSEFEFDNGIVYRTKFNQKAVIKKKGQTEYSYTLSGPFYSNDFKLEDDFIIQYY